MPLMTKLIKGQVDKIMRGEKTFSLGGEEETKEDKTRRLMGIPPTEILKMKIGNNIRKAMGTKSLNFKIENSPFQNKPGYTLSLTGNGVTEQRFPEKIYFFDNLKQVSDFLQKHCEKELAPNDK